MLAQCLKNQLIHSKTTNAIALLYRRYTNAMPKEVEVEVEIEPL